MSNKIMLPVVGGVLALWLVFGSWWYGTYYCGANLGASMPGLSLMDGNYEISSAKETFSFFESSADPILPESTMSALETLAFYLNDEKGKQLNLYGIYSSAESNKSKSENLGLARANSIKTELVEFGVPEKNILTKGIRFENASFSDGLMYGGVFFNFVNVNEKPNRGGEPQGNGLQDGRPTDLFQPVNIYFDVSEFDIILTEELEAYLDQVKIFLREKKSAQITIVGHTDSVGDPQSNLNLSETRARNVMKFMIRSGFDPKRLNIEYKGEDAPMATHGVGESKHKNRRVELRLKN